MPLFGPNGILRMINSVNVRISGSCIRTRPVLIPWAFLTPTKKKYKINKTWNWKSCYENAMAQHKTEAFCSTCKVCHCFLPLRECNAEWHSHQATGTMRHEKCKTWHTRLIYPLVWQLRNLGTIWIFQNTQNNFLLWYTHSLLLCSYIFENLFCLFNKTMWNDINSHTDALLNMKNQYNKLRFDESQGLVRQFVEEKKKL